MLDAVADEICYDESSTEWVASLSSILTPTEQGRLSFIAD